MALLRAVTTIGSYTALSRILGFVRDTLMASYLGAGVMSDCFFAAFKLPNFLRRLFAEGALSAAFVPLFTKIHREKGEKVAICAAEQVLSVLLWVLCAIVLVVMYGAEAVMALTAPGLSDGGGEIQLAATYLRLVFPYILCVSLSAVLGGVLNAVGRFAESSFAPSLLNLAMIGAMIWLAPHVPSMGHALSCGVLVSGFLQLFFMWRAAFQAGFPIKIRRPKITPTLKTLLRTMGPGAFGAGVMQVNLLIDLQLASLLPAGSISYLNYADRLNQLPLSLIGVTISTALLPLLSRQLQSNAWSQASHTQNRVLEYGALCCLPAAVALVVFSSPLIHGLFCYGSLTADQSMSIAAALSALAFGLPAYILIKILSTHFFARHDTKTPVRGALIALVANVVLNLALMGPLRHVGIALGTALAAYVNCGFLGYQLHQKGYLTLDLRLKQRLKPILAASFCLGLFLWGLDHVYGALTALYPHLGRFYRLTLLGGCVGTGFLFYVYLCHVLKGFDATEIKTLYPGKRKNNPQQESTH